MILARHMHVTATLVAVAVLATGAGATRAQTQEVGNCADGTAEAFLDVGNVRAKILNDGGLFWNGGQPEYQVPADDNVDAIFRTSLLLAGRVGEDVRAAATLYGPTEYWPGPIPDDATAPTDCERYDRIFEVEGAGTGASGNVSGLTGDVAEWPVHLGAPFVDNSDSPESYDPELGDHPELVGDQMRWWIMNDRGGNHEWSESAPLGVEVRATAFAFDAFDGPGNQTFYRYRIRNRTRSEIRDAYIGLFNDVDLGWAFDDYIGSDTTTGTAYFYNADNDDDGHYGEAPPAIGFTALRRPESTVDASHAECSYADGRTTGLTNHMWFFSSGGRQGDPSTAGEIYNVLRSRWKDGSHLMGGGDGYQQFRGQEIDFVFTGDPTTGSYWSELNINAEGLSNQPSDRSSVSGVGPFCLGPGDETEVVFAILWARGSSNLDSVTRLKVVAEGVQEIANQLLTPKRMVPPEEPEPLVEGFGVGLYPNPASVDATLRLGLPQPMDVQVDIFDTLGRRVADVVDARLDAGDRRWTIHTADWPPGAYLVRMQLDHITETRRLVVVR